MIIILNHICTEENVRHVRSFYLLAYFHRRKREKVSEQLKSNKVRIYLSRFMNNCIFFPSPMKQ